jgi:hypothetical protein
MEILKKLFTPNKDQRKTVDLEQNEKEAIIDLLMLAIYADNHLSLAEDKIMKEEIDTYSWNSITVLRIYLSESTARARTALTSETSEREFLEFIAERLESRATKSRALDLLSKLFNSDGTDEKEKEFTVKVKRYLGM